MARGIDMSAHRSTPLTDFEPIIGDLLLCMEPKHASAVKKAHPDAGVVLLGLYGDRKTPFIPDPYGKSRMFFDRCFDSIDYHLRVVLRTYFG